MISIQRPHSDNRSLGRTMNPQQPQASGLAAFGSASLVPMLMSPQPQRRFTDLSQSTDASQEFRDLNLSSMSSASKADPAQEAPHKNIVSMEDVSPKTSTSDVQDKDGPMIDIKTLQAQAEALEMQTRIANEEAVREAEQQCLHLLDNKHGARVTHACDHCRRRKAKCSGIQPCTRCTKQGMLCDFSKVEKKRKVTVNFRPPNAQPNFHGFDSMGYGFRTSHDASAGTSWARSASKRCAPYPIPAPMPTFAPAAPDMGTPSPSVMDNSGSIFAGRLQMSDGHPVGSMSLPATPGLTTTFTQSPSLISTSSFYEGGDAQRIYTGMPAWRPHSAQSAATTSASPRSPYGPSNTLSPAEARFDHGPSHQQLQNGLRLSGPINFNSRFQGQGPLGESDVRAFASFQGAAGSAGGPICSVLSMTGDEGSGGGASLGGEGIWGPATAKAQVRPQAGLSYPSSSGSTASRFPQ